jgi:hypothetical protein
MDNYKNKYLKYKYKYLELKNQQGGGDNELNLLNYQKLDPKIFTNDLVIIKDCVPLIYNSIKEILSRVNKYLKENGIETKNINTIYTASKTNLELLYSNLFEIFNNNLFLISTTNRNNIGLLNSLYIGTTTVNSILDYKTFYDQMMFIVKNNFRQILGDEDFANIELEQFKIAEAPQPEILSSIYSNSFNSKILIIQDNGKNYEITNATLFVPTIENAKTDHLIIIQSGKSIFQPLVLSNGSFEQRAQLFNNILTKVRSKLKTIKLEPGPGPGPESEPEPEPEPKPKIDVNFADEYLNGLIYNDIIISDKKYGNIGTLEIYENFNELTSRCKPSSTLGVKGYINRECLKNITTIFKPLFDKFKNLLYINSKGNGLCFYNSLFIFVINTKKWQGLVDLYNSFNKIVKDYNKIIDDKKNTTSILEITKEKFDKSYLNINYFSNSILCLAIYRLYTQEPFISIKDIPDDDGILKEVMMRDQKVPDTEIQVQIFSNIFCTNTMIISLINGDNYVIQGIQIYRPENCEEKPDHIIILKTRGHYQTLTLTNSTFEQREDLFIQMFNNLKTNYFEKMLDVELN